MREYRRRRRHWNTGKKRKKYPAYGRGGTIGCVRDDTGVLVPAWTAEQFTRKYLHPYEDYYELQWHVPKGLLPVGIDSTEITNDIMYNIVESIYNLLKHHKHHCAVIVTHGTDTMEHTAGYAALALQQLPCPVIFTGAQLRPAEEITDAPANIGLALRTTREDIAEVCVAFGANIYRGAAVAKFDCASVHAFHSPHQSLLGQVQAEDLLLSSVRNRTNADAKPKHYKGLRGRFNIWKMMPGMEEETIRPMLNPEEYDLSVVMGYADGNLPTRFQHIFEQASEQLHVIAVPSTATAGTAPKIYIGSPTVTHPTITYARGITAGMAAIKDRWLRQRGHILGLRGSKLQAWIRDRFAINIAGETNQGMRTFPDQQKNDWLWHSQALTTDRSPGPEGDSDISPHV